MTWEEIKARYRQIGNLKTDGCTAAPDLFWKDCCKEHDFYYKNPKLSGISRAEADKRLRKCMRSKGSGRIVSWTYWLVVRAIGWNFYKK